jgi:hypothetical protein
MKKQTKASKLSASSVSKKKKKTTGTQISILSKRQVTTLVTKLPNVNSKGKRKYTDDDDTEEDDVNPESKENAKENEDEVNEDSEDANNSDAFVAEDSSDGKLPRRKRKIIITEGDDDDSFVAVIAAPSGKPLFDLSTEDILAMERSRIRKQTVWTVPDSPSKAMKPPPTKTKYSVKPDDKWWVNGGMGPIMPGYGETNPLSSKIYGYVPSMTSFEEFAQGKGQKAKGKAANYQLKREACLTWVNKSLGRPQTQQELEEKYKGMLKPDAAIAALQVILEKKLVLKNFSWELLSFLRDVWEKEGHHGEKEGHHGFVFIPEGDNEGHKPGNVQYLENAPDVNFCNMSTDKSTRRCVLDSTASGLKYLGLDCLAWLLASSKDKTEKILNPLEYVRKVFQEEMNTSEGRNFEYVLLGYQKMKRWDPLESSKEYMLCVCGIQSSDGKTDHAVCIVGNWIFDSNFKKALSLNMESLNLCSSSADCATTFVTVTRGHLLRKIKK